VTEWYIVSYAVENANSTLTVSSERGFGDGSGVAVVPVERTMRGRFK